MFEFAVFTPSSMSPDEGAIKQMETCMEAGNAVGGSLSADHHLGYSAPIGASIAYPDMISPSGVGYDIGCGNKAVKTSLLYQDIREDLPGIMNEITRRISFGMGQANSEQVRDHPVFDRIAHSEVKQQRSLINKARVQLGTVGSGNHYVDLFREEGTDRVWIGVHFGSRGFGHVTASGFLALAQGLDWDGKAEGGEMYSPPVLLHTESALGHLYIEGMQIAGEYAYAGRDVVCDKVLEILGAEAMDEVHNHHNFAWQERVPGFGYAWVVRKGATPLWPGQLGFVGGSMGENAVIIEGVESPVAREALYSAPHGAGRMMSRTEAAGKKKKRWHCAECGWTQQPGQAAPMEAENRRELRQCPNCSVFSEMKKRWVTEKEGRINWQAVVEQLRRDNIILKGGGADEAPGAYKRLPEVLEAHAGHVRILHELRPIGVAMAGPDTVDLYKD
jgi:tRNA-splicing ligase RtcB